eukprot:scaffold59780_cov22-Prasinocladus_malaysianus.AAC.1
MELMEMLGIKTTQEQVDELISDIDEDGNGEIDFEEFLEVLFEAKTQKICIICFEISFCVVI